MRNAHIYKRDHGRTTANEHMCQLPCPPPFFRRHADQMHRYVANNPRNHFLSEREKMSPFQEWSRRIPPLTGPSLFQLPPPFIAVIGLRPGWRQKLRQISDCVRPSVRLLVHFFVDCLSSLFQIAFQLTRQRADLIVIRAEARSIRDGLGSPQHCTRTTYKW